MSMLLFVTVLSWLLIGVGTWLGYQLVRQNGRILLRIESIEQHVRHRPAARPPQPAGLPLGTVAPEFELPDLAGVRRKLSDFRGRDVLMMFFNPQCGFCTQMAADLAALSVAGEGGRPVPLVVTTGDAEENRKLVAQYGLRCVVLLQEEMQVAARYGAQGTPMGYRIDAAGRIASELAVGSEALLQLATGVAPSEVPADKTQHPASHGKQADPSLAKSRLNRNGLKAGTRAPEFNLPRLDGGDLSLTDFRGERVLLVFSDPDCGPCDELAPRLEQLHLHRPDLRVLVVSRRDNSANRAKAQKFGLSFPIVLQKQWEISLKYAMFATPIGYLIDERGILASDVAVGVGPILALVGEEVDEADDESWLREEEHASTLN